ncbi:hypothetical protein ACWERE_49980, partial [Rhodococcus koreensis]
MNRVARGDAWGGSASWCSRDSPIKPATWSSLAAGAARTHHQNWRRRRTPARRDLRRRRPRSDSTDLMGVAPALDSKLEGVSAPAGSAPAAGHI